MAREYNIKDDITRTINRKHSNNYLRYNKNQFKSLLQIGSKKVVQKQNASTISQIKVNYNVKDHGRFSQFLTRFSRNALYMLYIFLKSGLYTLFSKMELLKMSKIAQISTCVGLYVHFFMGGKMAVILAVVLYPFERLL